MQEYNVICDKCGRRKATCRTMVEINGLKYEANLCEQCFMKEQAGDVNNYVKYLSEEIICPTCKTSLSEIEDGAYVGCSDCYKVFRKQLLSKIQSMHGTRKHQGKRLPKRIINKKVDLSDRDSIKEQYFLAREEGRNDDAEELYNEYLKGGNANE